MFIQYSPNHHHKKKLNVETVVTPLLSRNIQLPLEFSHGVLSYIDISLN